MKRALSLALWAIGLLIIWADIRCGVACREAGGAWLNFPTCACVDGKAVLHPHARLW